MISIAVTDQEVNQPVPLLTPAGDADRNSTFA